MTDKLLEMLVSKALRKASFASAEYATVNPSVCYGLITRTRQTVA